MKIGVKMVINVQETIDDILKSRPEPHSGEELVQFLMQVFNAAEIPERFEDLSLKDAALKILDPGFSQFLPINFGQRLKIVRDIPSEKYDLQFVALHIAQFNVNIRIEVKSAIFVASFVGDDETGEVNLRFLNKLRVWLGISQEDIDNRSDRFMSYVYAYSELNKQKL
ncbi:hypothetical protein [Candidatus Desulfosporosinus nitrosoreducens]|uniref:hypothetical protein n=1 Tax=Candidatus Desulfosporosinus nitrosoreducens TaxID=3401928 RepID=UPI00280C3E08|nr:hypothetical protein [Desulfosporosinus sp. PR]